MDDRLDTSEANITNGWNHLKLDCLRWGKLTQTSKKKSGLQLEQVHGVVLKINLALETLKTVII